MAVGDGGRDNGVKELITTATALGSTTIDLGRKKLTEIPPEVLELQQLEFLYVEGNYLTTIPDYLFERLPNLKWLDLRNNHLTEVPAAIGSHKSIRNLLLEGNDIKELPLELGFATKLSGLNLASNPLEMPPFSVIERGTQEVLKFLREKYASRMELSEKQAVLGLRSTSPSSSEEDLSYSNDSQTAVALPDEEKAPTADNGVKIERVRLPPIFQAAAERPRNRTVDNPDNILRGQKSTQFEPKSKPNVEVAEPELSLTSPKRQRKVYSPQKNRAVSPGENISRGYSNHPKMNKSRDMALRGMLELQDADRLEEKTVKLKKKRKPRGQSPPKNIGHSKQKQDKQRAVALSYDNKMVADSGVESKTRTNKFEELKTKTVQTSEENVENENMNGNPIGLNLKEGDFVAIKVPPKLYIKGQPCLGKITAMADNIGLLTVHYYTGTYEGYWRPMMSRTSPYLRKVLLASILCKFKIPGDGRMSPITRAKVKKIVDSEEHQH